MIIDKEDKQHKGTPKTQPPTNSIEADTSGSASGLVVGCEQGIVPQSSNAESKEIPDLDDSDTSDKSSGFLGRRDQGAAIIEAREGTRASESEEHNAVDVSSEDEGMTTSDPRDPN